MLFNNTCRDILDIARAMIMGELRYHQGRYDEAFDHLRRSVQRDDHFPYDEPWGWMQPARHALGALLLEQRRVHEVEAVYRADLGLEKDTESATFSRACQRVNNVWSLHGLHECLVQQQQQQQCCSSNSERESSTRSMELVYIRQQLDKALARAEVAIHASCFCRQKRSQQQQPVESCCGSK